MSIISDIEENLWANAYDQCVRRQISVPHDLSVVDIFESAFVKYAKTSMIESVNTYLSYEEVDKLSRHFAAYIQNHTSLRPGDKFAIQMPNMLQYPVAIIGLMRAGIVIVNLNPLYTSYEMQQHLENSDAKGILILENFAYKLSEVTYNLNYVIISKPGDLQGFIKKRLINLGAKYIKKLIPNYNLSNYIFLDKALKKGSLCNYSKPTIKSTDSALIQYTGGTTGVLKGAVVSHYNLIANIFLIEEWVKNVLHEGEVSLIALPLYHIFSLVVNLFYGIHYGMKMHLIANPREVSKMLEHIKTKKITVMTGLNTLYKAMINNKKFHPSTFSKIKFAISAGIKLSPDVFNDWNRVGITIIECYGLTETSPAAVLNPLLRNKQGTVGVPISKTFIRIVNEFDEELPLGQSGEILIKGPQVIKEYYNNPEETHNVFRNGWLCTGDIGFLDDEGYLVIKDRKKDLINISGLKVFPSEVEEIVNQISDIQECALVGTIHNDKERAILFAVKKSQSLTKDKIISHCKKFLTNYKVPSEIIFVASLPKSPVGKVLKRKLLETL